MISNKNLRVILPIIVLLILPILACKIPKSSGVQSQSKAPTVSRSQATQPETVNTPAAPQTAATVVLTEGQVNGLVQQALQANPDQTIEDMQVKLQDGQVLLTGNVIQNNFSLPLKMALIISPDGLGGLDYQIVSATVGPLPLPQSLRDQIETSLNQNLKEQVKGLTHNLFIETVTIGNGIITLTGVPQ
jgi:hypothetical protein